MALGFIELAAGLASLTLLIYHYLTSNLDFWSSRRVKGPKPLPLFGTTLDVILGRKSMGQYTIQEYRRYPDEPYVGLFSNGKPVLMLRDPVLIKDVLTKDFSVFCYRGLRPPSKAEPLTQHLFFLEPERWRPLRQRLTTTFTSGKIKDMFYLLEECAECFDSFLDEYARKNPVIECRDLAAKFTTDVIGVCAFGLDMKAIAEEDSDFRKIARKVLGVTTWNLIINQLRFGAPGLLDFLSPIFYDKELNDFFIGSIRETMEYRRRNNVVRNDFIDLLMEIKDDPSKVNNIEMTDAVIASQAFIFFLAGYETSSATISNALYELAQNQSMQDKVRDEIIQTLNSNNGHLTYETTKSMKYLHKVFCETLRKYPPITTLRRVSIEPYTLHGTKLTIPKGTLVWIPVYAIQRDPQLYSEPEKFDPERFNEENGKHRNSSFYLPFGDGPRNCIGARFGNYQSKVGLIHVLKNYKVEVCDETDIPYEIDPKSMLLAPLRGIKLKFEKL